MDSGIRGMDIGRQRGVVTLAPANFAVGASVNLSIVATCFLETNLYLLPQNGRVRVDPYRQNLLNLFLARNDP